MEPAVELLPWMREWLGLVGKPLWVVDRARFLEPASGLGITPVSHPVFPAGEILATSERLICLAG
jgi:hypothetical protein